MSTAQNEITRVQALGCAVRKSRKYIIYESPHLKPLSCCVLVCHYAISNHHYGARHESPRPQIHRFRPQAPLPLPGVCFLSTARSNPIAHVERSCSPAGWICGKRASGHRGGARIKRLAPTCRTERARCGQTVAGHPAVRRRRLRGQWERCL